MMNHKTVKVEMPDEFEAQVKETIENALCLYEVWVYSGSSGWNTGLYAEAESEEEAREYGEEAIQSMSNALGLMNVVWNTDYEVVVKRPIA